MSFPKRHSFIDIIVLSCFAVLITWQPYYMHGKINIFEVGLYLPGIQGVLDGQVPFRDFFHLRGPFELYIPALMMKLFGEHLTVLYSYFYFGNVLCLLLCILIAAELIQTRFVLALFTFVLVARTFPRVAFMFWGGMRYAFGLIALWCAIKFFKKSKPAWMVAAGISSMMALFISVEMGVYCIVGVAAALLAAGALKVLPSKDAWKALGIYAAGACTIAVPYLIYLAVNGALVPYVETTLGVIFNMQRVIDPHLGSTYPSNFTEAFLAMSNPWHTNFKHMTPCYLYIVILGYLIVRLRKKRFSVEDVIIVCIGAYGFIMYNTGFRGIWTSHFEMALQLEKILLFFLLERFLYVLLQERRRLIGLDGSSWVKWGKIHGIHFLIFAFFMSSVGYSIARYNHRFIAYKIVRDTLAGKDIDRLKPLADEPAEVISIDRAKGILAPVDQAREFAQVADYVEHHVARDEPLLTYPELGAYNFFFDRPAFGGFPIVTFTWFKDQWHERFMKQLMTERPKHIIVEKQLPSYWEKIYLSQSPNRKKYQDVMDFIRSNYVVSRETALSDIYQLR